MFKTVAKTKAFFEEELQHIIDGMAGKTVYYVHPTAKMIKRAEASNCSFAASSISCLDVSETVDDVLSLKSYLEDDEKLTREKSPKMIKDHSIAVNTYITDNNQPAELLQQYRAHLSKPWTSQHNPIVPVMRCVADVIEHYNFLLHGRRRNETEVRFVFGNMIVEMLCRYFQFKLSLEQSTTKDLSYQHVWIVSYVLVQRAKLRYLYSHLKLHSKKAHFWPLH